MPDIAMCKNEDCPIKLECYRYTAESNNHRQSYMCFNWNDCDSFIPNNDLDDKKINEIKEYECARTEVSKLLKADLIEDVRLSSNKVKKTTVCLSSGKNICYYGYVATKIALYIFKNEFRKIDM